MSATKNPPVTGLPSQGPVIHDWRPEDPHFWGSVGKQIATIPLSGISLVHTDHRNEGGWDRAMGWAGPGIA